MRLAASLLAAVTVLAAACSTAHHSAYAGPSDRQPVIVELFTSEGCSSCPAADAALMKLVETQPVPGVQVIALEMHVDYWNNLGWADPFSSAAFTARQQGYASAFKLRGSYTPQMVVDGRAELVGSDADRARAAITSAARERHGSVKVTRSEDRIAAAISDLPEGSNESAVVWLAVTEDGLATAVPRGENAGATLAHGPVVRELRRLVSIAAGGAGPALVKDVVVRIEANMKRENVRAVVFVQGEKSLKMLGAGAVSMR